MKNRALKMGVLLLIGLALVGNSGEARAGFFSLELVQPLSRNSPIPRLREATRLPMRLEYVEGYYHTWFSGDMMTVFAVEQSLDHVGVLNLTRDFSGPLPFTAEDMENIAASYLKRIIAGADRLALQRDIERYLRLSTYFPRDLRGLNAEEAERYKDLFSRFFFAFAVADRVMEVRPGGLAERVLRTSFLALVGDVDRVLKRVQATDPERGERLASEIVAHLVLYEGPRARVDATGDGSTVDLRVLQRRFDLLTLLLDEAAREGRLHPDQLAAQNLVQGYQRGMRAIRRDAFVKFSLATYLGIFIEVVRSAYLGNPEVHFWFLAPAVFGLSLNPIDRWTTRLMRLSQVIYNQARYRLGRAREATNPLMAACMRRLLGDPTE